VWICFYFFLVFVIFQSDVELEALNHCKSSLHDCVSGHEKHVVLIEFYLLFRQLSSIHTNKRLARAFLDFFHCKSDMLFAFFNGRDEDLFHYVFKLNLDNTLKPSHFSDKVGVHFPIFILLLVVSHFFALLLVV